MTGYNPYAQGRWCQGCGQTADIPDGAELCAECEEANDAALLADALWDEQFEADEAAYLAYLALVGEVGA
jgi:hypothetical protein